MNAFAKAAARQKFVTEGAVVASNERVLVMLYERMLRDINEGIAACGTGDVLARNTAFLHAQEIVTELRMALDEDAWDAAKGMGSLYDWLLLRLIHANVAEDVNVASECAGVVSDLLGAWQAAYAEQQGVLAVEGTA